MWDVIIIISLLSMILFVLGAIFLAFKRTGTWKKWIIYAGIAFAVFIIGVINAPAPKDNQNKSDKIENQQNIIQQEQESKNNNSIKEEIKNDTNDIEIDNQLNQSVNQTPIPPTITTEIEDTTVKPVTQSQSQLYVGSIDSNKYHYSDCRHAKKIKEDKQIWFKDVNDAKSQGYVPCGVCKP